MNFLEAFENWVMVQDAEDFPDIIDIGDDNLTLADAQAKIVLGISVKEVYYYYQEEHIMRITFADKSDWYFEGTMNEVNNEIW